YFEQVRRINPESEELQSFMRDQNGGAPPSQKQRANALMSALMPDAGGNGAAARPAAPAPVPAVAKSQEPIDAPREEAPEDLPPAPDAPREPTPEPEPEIKAATPQPKPEKIDEPEKKPAEPIGDKQPEKKPEEKVAEKVAAPEAIPQP